MSMFSPGPYATERTDVDDTPCSARQHLAGSLLAAEEGGFQVYVEDEIPVGFGYVERVKAGEAGGIVDQTIERTERFAHLLEEAADLGDLG